MYFEGMYIGGKQCYVGDHKLCMLIEGNIRIFQYKKAMYIVYKYLLLAAFLKVIT